VAAAFDQHTSSRSFGTPPLSQPGSIRLRRRGGPGSAMLRVVRPGASQVAIGLDNRRMVVFYWVMSVLIVGTFVPSLLYLVLYAVTGEDGCMRRARMLWNYTRAFTLFGINLLIWGHVLVGLWRIWFA
jgi:hypothetical protein